MSAKAFLGKRPLSRRIYPYLWFVPVFGLLGAVLIYPWIWSLYLSFHKWSPIRPGGPTYVGLRNYARILTDPVFLHSLRITVTLVGITVPCQFGLGFGLALLLNRDIIWRRIFITIFIMPLMLTPSIIALIWRLLLHYQWGVVNYFLRALGFGRVGWMSDPSVSLGTVIMLQIWQSTSFVMLILLAGLQSISPDLYEVAEMDGATPAQSFWYITLPCLRQLIGIVLFFRIMFTLRVFDVIYTLWASGGPGQSAQTLGVYLYEHFRRTWRIGEASAISYILLMITMALTAFGIRSLAGRSRK